MAIDAVLVGKGASSASSTVTTSAGTTQASGSTFVQFVSYDNSRTISSVTDNKGNTYSIVGTAQAEPNAAGLLAIYACQNGIGGASHTGTVVCSGLAYHVVHLVEVPGALAASLDVSAQGVDTNTPFALATGTLAQADELVLAFVACNDGATSSVTYSSSNTTVISQEGDQNNYWTSAVSKLVVSSTASVSPSFTITAGTQAGLKLATFKAASGAAAAARPPARNQRAFVAPLIGF